MGFSIETGISAVTVFIQGLLSFFSPCVLPLVPLYLGYLAGGLNMGTGDGTNGSPGGNGPGRKEKLRLFFRVLCFTIGISGAFFVLGLGASAAGSFLNENRMLFARIGGVIVILFGLYQLGVFGSSRVLGSEHRLPVKLEKMTMSPVTAFIMGFAFSFAWTPCVGPALASVLLMVSTAASPVMGYLLIGVYTVGFVLPFLAVGLFTGTVLSFFRRHQKIVRYSVKAGAILMILLGVMTFSGWMNGLTGYLSSFGTPSAASADTSSEDSENLPDNDSEEENPANSASGDDSTEATPDAAPGDAADASADTSDETEQEEDLPEAPDFTLTDQYGNEHTLSEYKGKTVFLNFWATWCGPCKMEMPDIQALYEEYGENSGELIVLGVANPKTEEYPNNADESQEEIEAFLEENGYTYPVVMDTTGESFAAYGISAFPTTFMITEEGKVFGYASGTLTDEIIHSIVEQTMTGVRAEET